METESLSHKTLKNSSYTFINYVFPILFSIFITPIVVYKLGVTDYGVYVLVNTIIGFLGLLDLGLSTALIKYISEYRAKGDNASLQVLLESANSLFLIIGTLGFLLFLLVGKFLLPYFHISLPSQPHIFIVFVLAGILNFITAFSVVYSVMPAALQRFDVSARASLGQLTFFNFAILAAVLLGFKLKVILGLNVVAVIGQTFYLRLQCRKLLPDMRFGFGWDKEAIKLSYRFGILAAVSNIANSFLTQLDRLIIPIFLNPASLSYYSLPGNVAQKTSGVIGSVTGVLFPLTSSVASQGELEKLRSIYIRFFRNATIFAAAFTMAIVSFAHPILEFWLNKQFADRGTGILIILAATYFLLSLLGPLTNFLLGLHRVKFLALTSVIMAGVNVILLFLLLPKFGILGAAWAYFGAAALVPFIFWWAEKKYLNLEAVGPFYLKLYSKVLVVSCVFFVLARYLIAPYVTGRTVLIIVGPLTIALYLYLYKVFGFFEAEDLELFYSFWQRVKLRLKLSS
jgi:O-antigen/teichoic acid export membrane protein